MLTAIQCKDSLRYQFTALLKQNLHFNIGILRVKEERQERLSYVIYQYLITAETNLRCSVKHSLSGRNCPSDKLIRTEVSDLTSHPRAALDARFTGSPPERADDFIKGLFFMLASFNYILLIENIE